MEIVFDEIALHDIQIWKKSGNIVVQKRIEKLLLSIKETPFAGIGKPEALKYNLSGKWSRRITDADRIIYSVSKNLIQVHSLKGHYL